MSQGIQLDDTLTHSEIRLFVSQGDTHLHIMRADCVFSSQLVYRDVTTLKKNSLDS